GREEAALSAARELWQHPAATPPLRAQLLSYVGTDAWRRGELDRARRLYSEAEAMPIPVGMGRDLTVRRLALGDARLGSLLRPLLVPREEDHSPEESWERLERELPEHGLVRYLVGSYRLSQGDWVRAAANLEAALALELPDERFWREALLRLGRARFRAGAFGAARETFSRLDVPAESEAVRLEARDWMERCDFFARYGAALGLRVQVEAAQPAQGQGEGP
ncbi:MAG: hypothetical protein RBU30_22270, partial [Polyangia bacterium]|nr:hypothetical protein [Polyangia bacterium]